jgi:mycothiol synthase
MKLTMRMYQEEDDFWKMRAFLRDVLMINQLHLTSWHVARLDYARWHSCLNCANVRLEDVVYLWEKDEQLIAFMMPDGGPGESHLNRHPQWTSPELEIEMLIVAEERLAADQEDQTRSLCIWSPSEDQRLKGLLLERGYQKMDYPEYQWWCELVTPVEPIQPARGYTIRSLGDGLELLERCYASGLGFHEGDIHIAVENRDDPSWYRNIQTAPLYRRDLDLVAVTEQGAIAAFCTIWFDDVTRSAYFEPVATVPAHQRMGLGKALLTEGLRRLQRMGAIRVFVGGYSQAANALYRSVFGPEHDLSEPWVKNW